MRAVDGGVEFAGRAEVGYRANLWLAHGDARARARRRGRGARVRQAAPRRRRRCRGRRFIAPGRAIKVSTSASRSRLYHTGAIAETVGAGASPTGCAPRAGARRRAASRRSRRRCCCAASEDRFVVSVDSSGERLHRRGWRAGERARRRCARRWRRGLLALCDWEPSTGAARPDVRRGHASRSRRRRSGAWDSRRASTASFAFEEWPLHAGAHEAALAEDARRGAGRGSPRRAPRTDRRRRPQRRGGRQRAPQRRARRARRRAHARRRELTDARPTGGARPGAAQPPVRKAPRQPAHAAACSIARSAACCARTFAAGAPACWLADRRLAESIRLPVAAALPLEQRRLCA